MRKQYLHLSVYRCNECTGPVVSSLLAVRENEISRETGIRQVGAICLSCGSRQSAATEPESPRHFPPIEWTPACPIKALDSTPACPIQTLDSTPALAEALNCAELN